ncbi:MAG: hypothetical protein KF723_08960 [Rhizobiaceae bacterium]|nr:hypothetical protein [Rhizobiaceae bacterium]
MSTMSSGPIDPGVEIVESIGEWFVRVTENGTSQLTSFEREEFAVSFSEGQAMRLGVPVRRG